MNNLTIVKAGAGSGKTTDICKTIATKVAEGLDPARILATTFTIKAASELKGRVQQALLEDPRLDPLERLEKAERLEQAAIGTVHHVGRQLLNRYALHLGLSPQIEILDKDASHNALRETLKQSLGAPMEALNALATAFEIQNTQSLILDLLSAKRSNRLEDGPFRAQMEASAARLCQLMAPNGTRPGHYSFNDLYALAKSALNDMEKITDSTKVTRDAKTDIKNLIAAPSYTWSDFPTAKKINASTRTGADDALSSLREACTSVLEMPSLHQGIKQFSATLAECVIQLGSAYENYKVERGFLDFTDLEVLLLKMLEDPALQTELKGDFDLVVVDEFQDTNPIQLAIFQKLLQITPSARWVGDPKQAIYGFRGTDPELIESVWNAVPEGAKANLETNYRSQAGLVQFVGRVFSKEFGPEAALKSNKKPSSKGLERWLFDVKNIENEVQCIAAGIARLHDEDKIPYREMAVLTRTNMAAEAIGKACNALGIPALLNLKGCLTTRECALVKAGLCYVLDPHDTLAAAEILNLLTQNQEDTPTWLLDRLKAQKAKSENPWEHEPSLTRLKEIPSQALPPSVILQRVMDALDVGNLIRHWGEPMQRMARLDSLMALAQQYETQAALSGGTTTLSGLIHHLETLEKDQADEALPPYGMDAVTIQTYHGSKGLEWPVVILTGLDYDRNVDMFNPEVHGALDAPEQPLANRSLRYWPWPFGRNPRNNELTKGSGLEDIALASPEGQAATRRQDKESLRLLYVGCTRAKEKLVLAHRLKDYPWLKMLPDVDQLISPDLPDGEHKLEGIETTCVIKRIDPSHAEAYQREPQSHHAWLDPLKRPEEISHPARYHSPSSALPTQKVEVHLVPLTPNRITIPKLDLAARARFGEAIHGYFAALPSMQTLPPEKQTAIAGRCLRQASAETLLSAQDLAEMGRRFHQWMETHHPGAQKLTEVPLTAPRHQAGQCGGQWDGVADLLMCLEDGDVILVDHKSSPVENGDYQAKAATYAGQLKAYREMLSAQGITVKEMWLHFPLGGVMARVEG